ncbi:hypothetical protein J7356_21570, partial [Xanthomonas phaseoli pv. dieffenbachiae]|nr:hypothetical protein [Xanthomonas phaseoli pv. dieffenbachiae]
SEAGDAQARQAQEAEHSLEMSAVENRAVARVQASSSKGPEPGSLSSQSVQADAEPSALTQHVEMEQALVRQQDTAREQEAEPVRVIAQTTPATAEPLSASQSAASTNPEQETTSEQNRPSDAFLAEHDAPALSPAYLAQAYGQSLGGSAENRFPKEPADAESQQAQSTPAQERSAADPGGALFLEETM